MRVFVFSLACLISLTTYGQASLTGGPPDTLKVGLVSAPPFIVPQEDGSYTGLHIWLWEEVAEEEGIPFVYQTVPFARIFELLATDSIDLCINPLTVTADRIDLVDFTVPTYVAETTVVTLRERSLTRAMNFLRSFFSLAFLSVVSLLFLTLLLVGFCVWLLERKRNPEHFEPGWRGLLSGIWWSAVTMTTVGYGDKIPISLGGRMLGVVWMFTAIIIISGFTGSIASSLTKNFPESSARHLSDFKNKQVGTVQNSASEAFLRFRFFNGIRTYTSLDACFDALEKEEIDAIVYDEPILRSLLDNREDGKFIVLPIRFNPQFYAFGLSTSQQELRLRLSRTILEKTESADWKRVLSEYGLQGEE